MQMLYTVCTSIKRRFVDRIYWRNSPYHNLEITIIQTKNKARDIYRCTFEQIMSCAIYVANSISHKYAKVVALSYIQIQMFCL